MAGLVLERLSRVFPGNVVVLDKLSLEVHDGEFLVLVGPSGCGKSTTLRLIAGLDEPTTGRVLIGGREMNRVSPRDRDVAMVFQSGALYPHLSVYRNLAFGLELRRRSRRLRRFWGGILRSPEASPVVNGEQAIAERVRSVAGLLELEGLLDRKAWQLSAGQRQRVALGRALVREPAVFLLDEPLSSLDASLRSQLRQEIKQIHERRPTTTVYVTHDHQEALTLGERIAVLEHGRLQQVGTPEEIYNRPANRFVAEFMGNWPLNFIDGTNLNLPRAAREQAAKFGGRDVVLGVRAEDVWLGKKAAEADEQSIGQARVTSVESIGDAQLVRVEIDDTTDKTNQQRVSLISRIATRDEPRPGEQVTVKVDMRRVHWFDRKTGVSLPTTTRD